jgi:hypothetical protein
MLHSRRSLQSSRFEEHDMQKRIVGYQQDEEQHWMAELECGHHQHLRHQPPWTNRPWVTSAKGRASHLGKMLDCKKCEYGRPPDFLA